MYTFNKPSADFIMHRCALFVITALYGFIYLSNALLMPMKYLRDGMDEDDRGRLAWIVAKTCAACG